MSERTQATSIPMNSKLSLAEIDALIHNKETPAFSEKNSITYQGIIRNAHVTKDEGYLTTNGRKLTKEQLFDKSGHKIGTKLVDEAGKVYKVPHEWVLKDSYQLKNYTGGDVVSAIVYNNKIFILYDDEGLWALAVVDHDTKELIKLYQLEEALKLDKVYAAVIGSVYNSNKVPTLWVLSKQTKVAENNWNHEILEIELRSGITPVKRTVPKLASPLGHKMSATDVTGFGEGKTVGFEDIDQERRGFIRVKRGVQSFIPYFGTVAPNGLVTGEPIPDYRTSDTETNVPIEHTRLNNGTIAWNVKKASTGSAKQLYYSLLVGYDAEGKKLLTNRVYGGSSTYDTWLVSNISVNDKDTLYPDEDPRHHPTDYYFSNFADSKGVYYDWGTGWARTYFRSIDLDYHTINYLVIMTIGAVSTGYGDFYTLYRQESLMAKGKTSSWPYTPDHANERIYTVGGDNKGDNSVLGAVPFQVDLLSQGKLDPEQDKKLNVLKSQVFGLVETSLSFKETLLTTPSEGDNDENTLTLSWNPTSLIVFNNGEIYEIKKSSSVEDFSYKKVADYSFKLNVLDNKNLIKEDRDGNISLTRAFIPYNMDCIVDVDNLKLDPPEAPNDVGGLKPGQEGWDAKIKELYGKMTRDPNDKWFEGIGFNVNLDVDEPAMSFLLPKIQLPLWISEEDWPTFKNETIDRRNSILKPILKGSFLEEESVDLYYTLQKDSQDCTYKETRILKKGAEAEKAEWDVYGKSTYDVLKKGMSWWMEEANTSIFPIGIGSTIAGVNFITPSAQLPEGYASRLYTANNRLFLGFNYLAQIWHGATIFTIYGSNYYYDGQGIYFVGSDQDFSNNNFVTYALGMKFLANSGSEAYFYSDFEKRLYVFTGSNTLQAADLLSSVNGTIVDAAFSSKEQALYMLTDEGHILVRTQVDLCSIPDMNAKGHLEGTTEGCAIVGDYDYSIFSPHKGEQVIPFKLRTEHFGSMEYLQKLNFVDVVLYKDDLCPTVTVSCQTLNGIEKTSEELTVALRANDWRGSTYRIRLSPKLNVGNAFDVGIYSNDKIGVQSITFYTEQLGAGQGDSWQNNVTSYSAPVSIADEDVFE